MSVQPEDLPEELRKAIGGPVSFFQPCVYRTIMDSQCGNKDASLFGEPCDKRCTENVPQELAEMQAKLKVLYGRLLNAQAEQDLKERAEQEKARAEKSKRFNEYLKQASETVDSWPEWKQSLWRPKMESQEQVEFNQKVEQHNRAVETNMRGTQEVARSEAVVRGSEIYNGVPGERRITVGEQQDLGAAMVKEPANLKSGDIRKEMWRTYTWIIPETGVERSYTIEGPVKVLWRDGGSTHRVVDSNGVAHCVPIPGSHGCVLTWKNRDPMAPVNW